MECFREMSVGILMLENTPKALFEYSCQLKHFLFQLFIIIELAINIGSTVVKSR